MEITAEELKEKLDREGGKFFADFNQDIVKSLLLFYVNSGMLRYDQYKNYTTGCEGEMVDTTAIEKELMDELLTDKELEALMLHFFESHSYTEEKLMSCGGLRSSSHGKDQGTESEIRGDRFRR